MAEADNQASQQGGQQPGQVIAPGSGQNAPASPQTPPEQPQQSPAQTPAPQRPATESFMDASATNPPQPATGTITWTASEFIAHEKSSEWYLGLVAVAIVLAALVYLVTKDIISTIVVIVGAIAFGVLGSRKPKQQQYSMDAHSITVGQKRYDYGLFRSFSVVPEGAFSSIVFMPLKRFAQTTTIYYDPKDEDRIIDLLSQRLPLDEHRADAVDNLMRRIRF